MNVNPDLHHQQQQQQPMHMPEAPSSSIKNKSGRNKPFDEEENESIEDSDSEKPNKRSGRRKIKIEYIEDKNRRHITFSKRKAGIMKKVNFFLLFKQGVGERENSNNDNNNNNKTRRKKIKERVYIYKSAVSVHTDTIE